MAENKKNKVKTAAIKQPPLRDIDFQVDTVSVEQTYDRGAYMSPLTKTITQNFIKDEKKWNDWSQSNYVLIHEQKHRDNYNQGLYEYPVSTEMAYKLNMNDEVSANMASLIYLRQKYLETGDISVFDKADMECFDFYKKAIEKGEIKPGSPYKEDFDKEMRLIANGTQKMWLEKFGESYIEQNTINGIMFGDTDKEYSQYYNQNYEHSRKIALTIGGVDFTKYLDKDVEIPEKGKQQLASLKNNNIKPASLLVKKEIKNEPINPVDKNEKPEYRKWENKDGCRVSEIQYRKLPDMTQNIILKPITSYAALQKNREMLKQQMKDAAQKAKTQNKAPAKNKMKSDFQKYLTAKKNLVTRNDAIPATKKQVERTAQTNNTTKRKIQLNLLKLKQKQKD
ncbi:MAG: hypothetical protein Q4D80_05935 [Pseudomonadota bacterium]|nr:hypothetical protein [Pseudomonadota bacterium]